MGAVFIDVIMDYKFFLPNTCSQVFWIVFSYFVLLLSFSKGLSFFFLTFTGAISSITLWTCELKDSRREFTEFTGMLSGLHK